MYETIHAMIANGTLRVHANGTIESKRSPTSPWRVRRPENVIAPGRERHGGYLRTRVGATRILVHRLVWIALVGPIPEGMVVNHRNGNKHDNRIENLEVVTYSENMRHAIAHGLNDPTTPKNHSIDDDTVRAIRARIATGEPQSAIADDLGLTRNVVNRIVRGRTYRSVA